MAFSGKLFVLEVILLDERSERLFLSKPAPGDDSYLRRDP